MTEQEIGERPPFKMDTEIIPPGVDLDLAIERNKTIQAWRDGNVTAAQAHEALLRLYWTTQQAANGETNVYLMEVGYQFPVETGMAFEESEEIYMKLAGKADKFPYVRIFQEEY